MHRRLVSCSHLPESTGSCATFSICSSCNTQGYDRRAHLPGSAQSGAMLSFVSSCSAQAADEAMLLDHHVTPSRTQPIVQDLRFICAPCPLSRSFACRRSPKRCSAVTFTKDGSHLLYADKFGGRVRSSCAVFAAEWCAMPSCCCAVTPSPLRDFVRQARLCRVYV